MLGNWSLRLPHQALSPICIIALPSPGDGKWVQVARTTSEATGGLSVVAMAGFNCQCASFSLESFGERVLMRSSCLDQAGLWPTVLIDN